MKLCAEPMDLARRVAASALAGVALLAGPALAGDRALLEVIGYSEDGRYFAFEQFGVQDGAGFAYSHIFVVDLVSDSWVDGTPVRIQADSEDTTLATIRDSARQQAADELETLEIATPAETLALLGDGVPGADGQSLRFGLPGYGLADARGDYQLELETFATTGPLPCQEWFSTEPLGFGLALVDAGQTTPLHADDSLPESRGCPQAYRIYGVVVPFNAQDLTAGVALIAVYPGGFEGPDRRFVAVPLAN